MKITLCVIVLVLFQLDTVSQVHQEWYMRYNGPAGGNDAGLTTAVNQNGDIYIAGYSYNGSNYDLLLIKYDASGVQQWLRTYNGPANDDDQAIAIALDNTGNVFVTGYSYSAASKDDFLTIMYNENGVQQWVQTYSGPGSWYDETSAIAVDNTGYLYVAGFSNGGSKTHDDYALIKYSISGVQQWVRRYNGVGDDNDWINALALDNQGNVYVTGFTGGHNTGNYTTIKYNSSGVQQWAQDYNGPENGYDAATSITISEIGGSVFVTGYSDGSGTDRDYATVKYSLNGVQHWVQRYNGPQNGQDQAYAIRLDNTGDVFVTGGSSGDFLTVKYNISGAELWTQRYSGPSNLSDYAATMIIDNSNNIYITGGSIGSSTLNDIATIKLSSTGGLLWAARFASSADEEPRSIAMDVYGNIVVGGRGKNLEGNFDMLTIKYSQPIGILPISNEIPNNYMLSQNYPNPFNPATNINFELPKGGFVKLAVYDMLGKEIEILVSQSLSAGTYKIDWNALKYSSGIYYYRITTGEFSDTKKMILIK